MSDYNKIATEISTLSGVPLDSLLISSLNLSSTYFNSNSFIDVENNFFATNSAGGAGKYKIVLSVPIFTRMIYIPSEKEVTKPRASAVPWAEIKKKIGTTEGGKMFLTAKNNAIKLKKIVNSYGLIPLPLKAYTQHSRMRLLDPDGSFEVMDTDKNKFAEMLTSTLNRRRYDRKAERVGTISYRHDKKVVYNWDTEEYILEGLSDSIALQLLSDINKRNLGIFVSDIHIPTKTKKAELIGKLGIPRASRKLAVDKTIPWVASTISKSIQEQLSSEGVRNDPTMDVDSLIREAYDSVIGNEMGYTKASITFKNGGDSKSGYKTSKFFTKVLKLGIAVPTRLSHGRGGICGGNFIIRTDELEKVGKIATLFGGSYNSITCEVKSSYKFLISNMNVKT